MTSLSSDHHDNNLRQLYAKARSTRALRGHDAAQPLYEELLRLCPGDVSAAAHIASHSESIARHQRLGDPTTYSASDCHILKSKLQYSWKFTPGDIAKLVLGSDHQAKEEESASSAPLYLPPIQAGQAAPPLPDSPLATCIQLFLLAVCVPLEVCERYLGRDMLDLLEKLGIIFLNDTTTKRFVVPYCHVTPVDCNRSTLYIVTDLHPNVLSITSIDEDNEAVMYIGPDSLALLDHWIVPFGESPQNTSTTTATIAEEHHKIVDLCTGSGIQALAMAKQVVSKDSKIVCVDLNPRALRMTAFNFALNGMPPPTLVLSDLLRTEESSIAHPPSPSSLLHASLQGATMILANPPFLPVPIHDLDIATRHGLFSSGGPSGEDVLQRIVELAAIHLVENGRLAVVSEFMNPRSANFEERLRHWWGTTRFPATGVLFFNEECLDADTYARKRASSSKSDYTVWLEHLKEKDISHVSPGLVFVKKATSSTREDECSHPEDDSFVMHSFAIPKTEHGSIWTPTNSEVRRLSLSILKKLNFL